MFRCRSIRDTNTRQSQQDCKELSKISKLLKNTQKQSTSYLIAPEILEDSSFHHLKNFTQYIIYFFFFKS